MKQTLEEKWLKNVRRIDISYTFANQNLYNTTQTQS